MTIKAKYAKRTDRWKNLTPEQKALQNQRRTRWKLKNHERMMLQNTRDRARAKNIPFNLDISDIHIPEYCPVLGIKLERGTGKPTPNSPSIDKIIPALGYVKGNIIIVSYRANTIKNNATVDELTKIATFYTKLIEGQKQSALTS